MKTNLVSYGVTVLVVTVAAVVRWLMIPFLGHEAPFSTFIIAVIFTAWYQGVRSSILAMIIGFITAVILFIHPHSSIFEASISSISRFGIFFIICLAIATFANAARKAQDSLAEANKLANERAEMLRITFASIGDGIITTDAQGKVSYLNGIAESLTGWNSDDARGHPFETVFRIVNETNRRPVDNPGIKALKEGAIVGLANHTILIAKDNTERPIDDSAAPIFNKNGIVVGCVLVFRDITERKREQVKLTEALSRLESALVTGEIGTWEFDMVQNVVRADRNLARMFGVTEQEAAGAPLEVFMRGIHPDDQARVTEAIKTSIESHREFESEYRVIGADQAVRWVVARGRVDRDANGNGISFPGVVVDITRQKTVEEQLRASEERTRFALAAAELGAWNIDPNTNTLKTDERFREILGMPTLEISYEQAFAIIHPDDRTRIRDAIAAAIRADSPVPYAEEYRVIDPDGAIRWVFAKGGAILGPGDSDRKLLSFAGTIADITQRKRTEERERELLTEASTANAKFEALFDQGPLFAAMMALDGTTIEANRLCLDACGYTKDQVIGKLFWDCPWWNSSASVMDRIKEAAAAASRGETFRAELPFFVAGGAERIVEFAMLPIKDETGRVLFLASTGTDITDRRRAENDRQKFVTLAENISDFIGMFDLNGVPFYLNDAGLKLVGLDKIDEQSTIRVSDFFFPEDQKKINEEFFPSIFESGHGELDIRFRHFKTRKAIWVLFKVIALFDSQGNKVGFATITRDMTQHRELEDNLRQLASDLSEGNHRKDEFLATLAHELRNPLAPIRNGLQLIKLANGDLESISHARDIMERQLSHMVRLVDDLLDVSRISRGKLDLRRTNVDLASIIGQAIETTRPTIESTRQQLTLSLPEQPIPLNGDAVRLVQVFSNLLNNSCKYSEPNGHISISAEINGDSVAVSLKDTGIGIAPDMLSRIFEMFTQVDHSLEKSEGGLGIGLTLVERILQLHGGSITATSEGLGKGSEFVVHLPIVENTSTVPKPVFDQPQRRGTRILVVDDNRDSASSLAALLELTGNQIETAYDGLAALETAAAFRPQVVLLDIGLPRLNGYEVARKLRQQPWGKSIVLVALTGWGQDEDRQKSRDAGFDQHMVKPVDYAVLSQFLAGLEY